MTVERAYRVRVDEDGLRDCPSEQHVQKEEQRKRTDPSLMNSLMLCAINSLHRPLPWTNSLARSTSSPLNSLKLISGGGRWRVKKRMKSAVPLAVETGLKEAFSSLAEAERRRARSSWMVFESERETSSARV